MSEASIIFAFVRVTFSFLLKVLGVSPDVSCSEIS